MVAASDPLPPAGWAWDLSKRHEQRYWDGTAWGSRVRDGNDESEDPVVVLGIPVVTDVGASEPTPETENGDRRAGLAADVRASVHGAVEADTGMADAAIGAAAAGIVISVGRAVGRRARSILSSRRQKPN